MSKRRGRRAPAEDKYGEVLEHVLSLTEGGRLVSELFTEIPSASLYPDYRDIVQAPISLAEISKRTRLKAYDQDDEFLQDFEQMAINATLYNGEDSPVVDDAYLMYDFVLEALGRPQSETTLRRDQLRIVQDLIAYKYKGRTFADAFMKLPPKSENREYYKVIKNPRSFSEIQDYLDTGVYKDWDEFESSVGLIFTNAMSYNAEGSPIHSDARTLSRQLHNRVLKHTKNRKPIPAMRFRSAAANTASTPTKQEESEGEELDFEPPVHRFDDDDDDDFEVDQEADGDDDDEKLDFEGSPFGGSGGVAAGGPPQKQIVVRDETIKRAPGTTARDAMLQLVTCASILHHSVLHTMHYGVRGDKPQIPPAYARDMVQVRVSASKKDAFTSFATTLPSYHHTSTLTVYLHDRMRMLPHSLTVLLNGRKLQSGTSSNADSGSGVREEYELRLSPGLNQVTVAVIGPDSAGTVRPFGPPPIVGSEPDEERTVLWLNLSR